MPISVLDDRLIIEVKGEDATSFLQNIVTANVGTLANNESCHSALLSPQGKILFEFLIIKRQGRYWLDCHKNTVDVLSKRLTLYKLRADVVIEKLNDISCASQWHDQSIIDFPHLISIIDPRNIDLGQRIYFIKDNIKTELPSMSEEYNVHRVFLGIAEAETDGMLNDYFPSDIGMDLWGSVAYDKGCFIGQEVVARMYHRQSHRRRPVVISSTHSFSEDDLVSEERQVLANGKRVGYILKKHHDYAIAIIRLDRIENITLLQYGNMQVKFFLPPWLKTANN